MTGLSLWMVLAYWRGELRIRGTRLVCRGVIKGQEIDLTQVTHVRWQPAGRDGGRIVLLDGSGRIAIDFQNYEIEQCVIIVQYLRSVVEPEVQTGWNLFAYKTVLLEPRSVRLKPGPDEVLIRRQRWDRDPLVITRWWRVSGELSRGGSWASRASWPCCCSRWRRGC